MNAYFISGLGAGKKAFKKIQLPSKYNPVFLDWIPPEKNETLANYAKRFAPLITSDDAFVLIGLSFGGMLASEISTFLQPQKTIIISSVATCDELPWYFRNAGRMGLHKTVPLSVLKAGTIMNRILGAGTAEDKQIIYDYVKYASPELIRWSIDAIMRWQRHERLPGIIHVHGSKDNLLPIKYTHPDYIIRDGGHLMVLNRAGEVNRILEEVLEG